MAVGVEQLHLVGGLEQRLALALAVDVDQLFAELFEHGHGDGPIIDIGMTTAGPGQTTGQDDLRFLQCAAENGLDFRAERGCTQLEPPRDMEFLGPGAQQIGRAALAQQQAKGPEEE